MEDEPEYDYRECDEREEHQGKEEGDRLQANDFLVGSFPSDECIGTVEKLNSFVCRSRLVVTVYIVIQGRNWGNVRHAARVSCYST